MRVRQRAAAPVPAWILPFLGALVGWAYFACQLITLRHAALQAGQ